MVLVGMETGHREDRQAGAQEGGVQGHPAGETRWWAWAEGDGSQGTGSRGSRKMWMTVNNLQTERRGHSTASWEQALI